MQKIIAALLLLALSAGTAGADTVAYFGGQCLQTNDNVVPVKHGGTGCPSTGSWNAEMLTVGTDGTLCYSTAAGSPGTWVEVGGGGSLDGSDVGLADSPSSDGDYVLRRASGVNSWANAGGGGSSPVWVDSVFNAGVTLNSSGNLTTFPGSTITIPHEKFARGTTIRAFAQFDVSDWMGSPTTCAFRIKLGDATIAIAGIDLATTLGGTGYPALEATILVYESPNQYTDAARFFRSSIGMGPTHGGGTTGVIFDAQDDVDIFIEYENDGSDITVALLAFTVEVTTP